MRVAAPLALPVTPLGVMFLKSSPAPALAKTAEPAKAPATADVPLTVATFNVENFFTPGENKQARVPVTQLQYDTKLKKLELAITKELHSPDVVALEEVGNQTALDDLLSKTDLGKFGYKAVMLPTNDKRGINVAVMYNANRVTLDGARQANTPTPTKVVHDNAGGSLDPGMLFARPPLIVDFSMRGAAQAHEGVQQLELIVNHFVAKLGGPKSDPRRTAQGAWIGGLIDASRAANPTRGVIALGDFNSDYGEDSYKAMTTTEGGSSRVEDTPVLALKPAERYTYKYNGSPDMLDHMLVTGDLAKALTTVVIPHFDSDDAHKSANDVSKADGVSDHDPILASFDLAKLAAQAVQPAQK
ncbi:MAG: endonuclease/exonuclease/phosphatase family protein [Thermoleophilia bacterium]|nr:endonuclease/exonuclease/phosphatase family protein [Thermoleophilia bacterium]